MKDIAKYPQARASRTWIHCIHYHCDEFDIIFFYLWRMLLAYSFHIASFTVYWGDYQRRFKERQLTGVVYSFKSAEHRMDDRHRDILYMAIFTKMPAVVALVDRGRPRFHKHEIGRHCDSRRDFTRWNPLLRRGRSSALTKLAAFGRWRCRSSSTLWRFPFRSANPLLPKSYSTLVDDIHPAWHSRSDEFDLAAMF